MSNIRHREDLLCYIATGLRDLPPRTSVQDVEVTFEVGRCSYLFSLAGALEALANDLYWDERGDWSCATLALVRRLE